MKTIKIILTLFLLIVCINSFAQDTLLNSMPSTKQEFISSEKQVIATTYWIENTPVDQDKNKRKQQTFLLLTWITNSPTVTLVINSNVMPFTNKNSELLMPFMGGWTRYCLQNNYSTDSVMGSLAGIRSAIKLYKLGGLKKDKEMDKLIELDNSGGLEAWVREKMVKK